MPQSILIIEDDEMVRHSIAAWLIDADYIVHESANCSDGMHAFEQEKPDLVLLDLGIGQPDGMEILREIKRVRNETPVIIVSGRTRISDAIEAFKAGAWDYVTKPIPSMAVFTNTIRNCLDQTRLQSRIRETQEHLYRLVQNLPVIIFIINRNLEFEFLNDTSEHLLGYSAQEILESPRPFLRCIVPEDRKKFTSALRESFQNNSIPLRLEFRFIHKKGYTVHLQAQSITYARTNAGPPDRLEGMIMDMTRNSYLDNLLHQNEKLNLLRSMTEEVAHEIRNPLVSLGGFARKLHSKYPEAAEAQVILKECEKLEQMVQRIGTYLDPIDPRFTSLSLATSVSFAIRLLQTRLDRHRLSCLAEINFNLANIRTDPDIFHQILMTLLGAAMDMLECEGRMTISATEANDLVTLTLRLEQLREEMPLINQQLLPFDARKHPVSQCYRLLELLHGHLEIRHSPPFVLLHLTLPKAVDELAFKR